MALRIAETAALSDVGRQRGSNEDRFLEHSPVFAVADGMGGARAGEIASGIAVEALAAMDTADGTDEARLSTVARSANRRIYELAQADEARAGMGTTLTAVIVGKDEIAIGHVGDSRLYRLRDGSLERLTKDHSLVEEMVRAGKLAPEDAEHHPQKSIITRALGPEPDVEVETFTAPAQDGDVLLICSDGLTGMVSEAEIAGALDRAPSLGQAAHELIDTANSHGGRDNITVVLFRLGARSDGEEPDTLSGRDTEPGLDATAVHAAVAEAEGAERHGGRGRPSESEADRGEGGDPAAHDETGPRGSGAAGPATATAQETLTLSADEAERLRREERRRLQRAPAAGVGGAPEEEGGRAGPAPPRRPSRGRRLLTALAALVLVVAVGIGAWVAVRSVYFLGASPQGLVTLYRGLPYDLPFGIRLYGEEFESTVPVTGLPALRRQRILDHQLRDRRDAVDLMRSLQGTQAGR